MSAVPPTLPALIRAAIDAEAASGWARLRRVPSTYTRKILDYVSALPAVSRDRLFEAFTANALFLFDPGRDVSLHARRAGHPEFVALAEALPRITGWEYLDVRSLRALAGERRSGRPTRAFATAPADVVRHAEAIRPVTAARIRRAVAQALGERLGATAEDRGSGEWRYAGARRGRAFVVSVDYGGSFGDQLRYEVEYDDGPTGLHARRLTWEHMLGAGLGRWNLLTADNLAPSADLLAGMVEDLVALPDRLGGGA